MSEFVTKDSGQRQEFPTGMRRDVQTGKPRFDLVIPENVPLEETLLYRWAMLLGRGAEKYSERNWELSATKEELDRFKASGLRHCIQAFAGEEDEDHFAATVFNLQGFLHVRAKLRAVEETIFDLQPLQPAEAK